MGFNSAFKGLMMMVMMMMMIIIIPKSVEISQGGKESTRTN